MKSANTPSPLLIHCGGEGGKLGWLSTVCELVRQPQSVVRLIALLDHHDKMYFEPRRKLKDFPAPDVRAIEVELIAQRWQLVGSSAFLADRRARRQVCALKLRTNGQHTRRIMKGNPQQALLKVGAA